MTRVTRKKATEALQCNSCTITSQTVSAPNSSEHPHVMFIGISGKSVRGKDLDPLSGDSRSGSILTPLLTNFGESFFYKTNLVKCHPTDFSGKTRYPSNLEIDNCKPHTIDEINLIKPRIVFLLGKIVAENLLFTLTTSNSITFYSPTIHLGVAYFPIHHPSYISIYKRKHIHEYITKLSHAIYSHALL